MNKDSSWHGIPQGPLLQLTAETQIKMPLQTL